MNIIDLQDSLKDLPDSALIKEMQMPTGTAPQFLVLSELKRRKRMRDEFQRQQNMDMPTVAEEVVTAAGVPQEGIMGAARAMAPNTNVAQNTGMDTAAPVPATRAPQPQMMADGGIVKMQTGGLSSFIPNRAMFLGEGMYNRGTGRATVVDGVTVELLPDGRVVSATTGDTVPQELAAKAIAKLSPDLTGDTAAFTEFEDIPSIYRLEVGMPTQEDLDLKAQEAAAKDVFPEYVSPNDQDREYNMMQELQRQAAIERGGYEAAARAEDAPTFMGDVLPFLGDASVAAGKSLYDSFFPQKTVGPDDVIAELREQEAMRNADPIQDEINRLRAIISNPDASAPEKANAADDLMKLQERIAVTQTGGNIAATVEGQGIELEAPYIMGPFGPMIDPNYKTPGKTGQSIVDQAALQGSEALQELADTGLYPDNIIREAEKSAKLADFEAGIYDINKDVMDVQNALENPYLPDDARAEMEDFLKTAEQQKRTIATQTGVSPQLFAPDAEATPNITGGYEGLIDTSPVTIAEQAAEAAEDTIDMDALTAEADEERAGYEAAAKALQEVEKDPDAPKVPKVDPDPAGFGSTDSRIAKMLADRQKEAESDKWMALAYAGMELMKPTATIGEGLGKAGQAGLGYLTKSKQGLRDFETDMLKLQTQMDIANIRAAASGKTSGKTSATAYAALERAYSDALTIATENPTAPNLARLEELEDMIREARSAQFGTVTTGNTNSGVIKTPSAQAG